MVCSRRRQMKFVDQLTSPLSYKENISRTYANVHIRQQETDLGVLP